MPTARDLLLDRALGHVAQHGMGDRSLRELATAIGTSHRMLLYHFGSRSGLVAAIVERMEALERARLEALAAEIDDPATLIRRHWATLTAPEARPFVRLFFEVLAEGAAGRPGTERVIDGLVTPWLDAVHRAADRLGRDTDDAEARLAVAVIRGLLVDVLATGDATAATAALEAFIERWTSGGGPASPLGRTPRG